MLWYVFSVDRSHDLSGGALLWFGGQLRPFKKIQNLLLTGRS